MVEPGGKDTPKTRGSNEKSLAVTLVTERAVAATVVAGTGGAATGPIVPFKANTHSVSPRGKSSWKLPPDDTATYCWPSTSYVTAGALAPAPVWNCHSICPDLASRASKLPL